MSSEVPKKVMVASSPEKNPLCEIGGNSTSPPAPFHENTITAIHSKTLANDDVVRVMMVVVVVPL